MRTAAQKQKGSGRATVRGQSKRKRATFLGARINSPIDTLLRLALSRKPERTTDRQSHISADWPWIVSLRVVLLKSLRLMSDCETCSSPGGELQMYLNPVKTWLCWLSLKRIEFRVCIQKAYSRVLPFLGWTVVWWSVLVSFSKQCCLSRDPRMMSLVTWLYTWKWSKSRWPWLRLNGCFVHACVCLFMCKHCSADLCLGYYGVHTSCTFFQSYGEFL